MPSFPASQIADAHLLTADGKINLFELTPNDGSGTVRFKADNDVTWRGNLYTGLPLAFTGEKRSASGASPQPNLTVGGQNIDLGFLKPLVHDGYVDGAVVVRHEILLDDLLNDRLVKATTYYRVRRVPTYGRSQIVLQLATLSDSLGFSLPFRQYLPPAFPSVNL